jgi:hypothetical protein
VATRAVRIVDASRLPQRLGHWTSTLGMFRLARDLVAVPSAPLAPRRQASVPIYKVSAHVFLD